MSTKATISVAVLDETGKLIMECILETKAATMKYLSIFRNRVKLVIPTLGYR